MQYPTDKQHRSVKEAALIKWFVRWAYRTPEGDMPPEKAINGWAEVLLKRMDAIRGTRGPK